MFPTLNLIGGISQSTLNMKIPQIKLGITEFLFASLSLHLNCLVYSILKIYWSWMPGYAGCIYRTTWQWFWRSWMLSRPNTWHCVLRWSRCHWHRKTALTPSESALPVSWSWSNIFITLQRWRYTHDLNAVEYCIQRVKGQGHNGNPLIHMNSGQCQEKSNSRNVQRNSACVKRPLD